MIFGVALRPTVWQVDFAQVAWVVGSILFLSISTICWFLYVIAPGAWAIGDAQRRGQTGYLVVALFTLLFFLGPLCLVIWLLIRPRTKLIDRDPEFYTNPEDALSAASKLDKLGHWDAAIESYQYAAKRWPENHDFIAASVAAIREKQALG